MGVYMLINWIKKKVLKSIIKDITKQLPKYKEIAFLYIDQNKDEIIKKVENAIKSIIEQEISRMCNK